MTTERVGRPRVEDKQPYIRGEIVRAYGETGSMRQTALAVGVDVHTVERIFARNPEDFATANKLAARNFLTDADTCRCKSMEPERLEQCSSPQLAVMAGIYTDKAIALTAKVQPTVFDYEGMSKVIWLHDALVAECARRGEKLPIDVTPPKGQPSASGQPEQRQA